MFKTTIGRLDFSHIRRLEVWSGFNTPVHAEQFEKAMNNSEVNGKSLTKKSAKQYRDLGVEFQRVSKRVRL